MVVFHAKRLQPSGHRALRWAFTPKKPPGGHLGWGKHRWVHHLEMALKIPKFADGMGKWEFAHEIISPQNLKWWTQKNCLTLCLKTRLWGRSNFQKKNSNLNLFSDFWDAKSFPILGYIPLQQMQSWNGTVEVMTSNSVGFLLQKKWPLGVWLVQTDSNPSHQLSCLQSESTLQPVERTGIYTKLEISLRFGGLTLRIVLEKPEPLCWVFGSADHFDLACMRNKQIRSLKAISVTSYSRS